MIRAYFRRKQMADKDDLMTGAIVSFLLRAFVSDQSAFHANHFEITQTALDGIESGLHNRIFKIASPSLSQFFLEYLNEHDMLDLYLEDPESAALDRTREAFYEEMTATGCAVLKARLPELLDYVYNASVQYHAFIRELIQRVDSSYDEICSRLLGHSPFHLLTGVSVDCGDSHNHGRSTTILSTDTDRGKFVYKPHDVRIDYKSFELIGRFFGDCLRAPAVCVCDGYGFAEYIWNEPADTEADAKQYFYHLGGLAAVVQLLGSCDLHHSNVLSTGVYPVVIDYELMVLPSDRYSEKSLANAFSFSLFYSSLMPSRSGDTELSILFARDDGNKSAPVIDGERKTVPDYPESFFRGFREIYTRCMEKREEIKSFALSMKGIYVRHIYRGSGVYGELLKRTWEPSWLQDEHLREALFEKLSIAMKRNGAENADKITNSEIDAVLRGDIPYFYSRTDSCDLYADGEVVFPDFFRVSSMEHLLSRINYLSHDDMVFEETLLRKAITRVIEHHPSAPEIRQPIPRKKEISDEALRSHAEQIFRELVADAVYTPSGEVCWFGPDYFMKTGMHLLGSGLVDGTAGLALFFAALHSLSENDDVKAGSAHLLGKITARLNRSMDDLCVLDLIHPNTEDVSMTNGLTGKLLSLYLIGKYLKDDSYWMLCRKMLSVIQKIDLEYEGMDVLTGLSGLLKLLCKYDAFFSQPGVPQLCEQLADRILSSADLPYNGQWLWKTMSSGWPISGAGHGQSGVASALWLAGQKLHRQDFIAAALAGFHFEEEIYSEKTGAWPDRRARERTDAYMTGYCSGAPGIGMNALLLQYENADLTIERAVKSCLKEPLLQKDFLCCGNSAVIDFLLSAGLKRNDAALVDEARIRMAAVIEDAARNGHYQCMSRSLSPIFSPSLFYGVAGIGYEMLRLTAPDKIESVLL